MATSAMARNLDALEVSGLGQYPMVQAIRPETSQLVIGLGVLALFAAGAWFVYRQAIAKGNTNA